MKAIEVIPLGANIFRDSLSYFTAKDIAPGAVIEISVRQKKVKAIVTKVSDVAEVKSKLRGADFSLKKVEKIEVPKLVSGELMRAVTETAAYYLGYSGQILNSILPKAIINHLDKLTPAKNEAKVDNLKSPLSRVKNERLILQQSPEERITFYKSLVREEFARGHSVFITAPTVSQVAYLKNNLARGIEDYTYALASSLSPKKTIEAWNKIVNEKHPVLIVATPVFISLPRADLKTIVVDQENSESYKGQRRPFFDFRFLAETLARELSAKFILADTVLRIETMHAYETGRYQNAATVKNRSFSTAESKVIGAKSVKEGGTGESLGEELVKDIREALSANEKVFIWSARRGLAPIVICRDCGRAVLCLKCLMPVTLHKEKGGSKTSNILACHHCHETRSASEVCGYCQSWNLIPLGVGVEKVMAELTQHFPETKLFQIDSDNTPTRAEAQETLSNFLTEGGILVGTEMAVNLLQKPIENAFVASLDALMSLPEFKISEKVFHLLIKLRLLSTKKFIIQTRNPDWPFFSLAATGNIMEFYREEVKDRENLNYPPFRTLIKITREGTSSEVLSDIHRLEIVLKDYAPDIFEVSRAARGEYIAHALIRLNAGLWPEKDLSERLYNLPPNFRIEVDPQTLL